MHKQAVEELLNAHAEGLKDGLDLTEALLAEEPVEAKGALAPFLALVRRVKSALPWVEPRRDFVSDLRERLAENARQARILADQHRSENRRRVMWLVAGLGGLVYVMGMATVGLRLTLTVLSFIAAILSWRSARPAAPRM